MVLELWLAIQLSVHEAKKRAKHAFLRVGDVVLHSHTAWESSYQEGQDPNTLDAAVISELDASLRDSVVLAVVL